MQRFRLARTIQGLLIAVHLLLRPRTLLPRSLWLKRSLPRKRSHATSRPQTTALLSVGLKGKVRVDALVWSVANTSTAPTIGEQQYGLGEKADGVFVIVKLNVKSEKDETATIASETVKLSDGETTTEPDDEAGISVDDPLIFEEIGPDSTKTATLVFDIPLEKLSKKLELRFGELGFGSTEGFIALPTLG